MNDEWSLDIHHRLNIKRRTCTEFIPKAQSSDDAQNDSRCGCNRLRREHSWDVINGNGSTWDQKKHTKPAVNNAYGLLDTNQAKYVRCDIETDPKNLVELMFSVWKMKKPRLLMCIIGGAKYFKLNERLEREFIKGIIQVALKADGWIITSGFKTGVVQLVGEAIHDHKVTNPRSDITAIGCSKWGAVKNRDSLISKVPSKMSRAESFQNLPKNVKGQQLLEPNHTHFLLLDDGTYYNYDTKDYRTRLVEKISSHENRHIPCVTIVVEGGPDTLVAIYNDLSKGIPIVLIDGSGRIPNLLAKFLSRTRSLLDRTEKKNDETKVDARKPLDLDRIDGLKILFENYEEDIRNDLKEICKGSKSSDKMLDELYSYMIFCLQPSIRKKIQIFSLTSDHDLDDTIFEAIIEAKQSENAEKNDGTQLEQLIQLALDWDALALAKEYIIKDDLHQLSFESRERLFLEALRLDRPFFVQAFIKLNFDVVRIFYNLEIDRPCKLKWDKLSKIYETSFISRNDRLCVLSKYLSDSKVEQPEDLDRILRRFIGDYMKPIYDRPSNENEKSARRKVYPRDVVERENEESRLNLDPEEIRRDFKEFVYRDLFLWSILTNRVEMSKVFLVELRTRIGSALIGSKIFKSFVDFAADNESKEIFNAKSVQFEEIAEDFLKSCYNADEEKSCEIVIRRLNLYGDLSCLQVAVDADDKSFVSQPCCDLLLNNIWFDSIQPVQSNFTTRIQFWSSFFTFGLISPFVLSFRPEKQKISPQINAAPTLEINQTDQPVKEKFQEILQRLDHNGINYSDDVVFDQHFYSFYFRRLTYFHQSPLVKYFYNCLSYFVFLLFFSYYLLFKFQIDESLHWTEIAVIVTVSTMLVEEIRQFFSQENRTLLGKLSNYFIKNQFFNMIRVLSYIFFYVGLILRCISINNADSDKFTAARIVLAYDLELWFLRSFSFLGIVQKMGPKLVMIRKMIVDLSFFTYIIFTAMTAYGVASRAMFDQKRQEVSFDGRSIFREIFYPTYYLMYGNIGDELASLDEYRDDATSIATHVLLAFHMLFVNILLINLLIAMFSFTFESVQTQTDRVWRYERYGLVREYFERPPLFPPFIVIVHVYYLLRHLTSYFLDNPSRTASFQMIPFHRQVEKDWSDFESFATNLQVRSLIVTQSSSNNSPKIVETKSNLSQTNSLAEEITSLRKSLVEIRSQSEELSRCMQWMIEAMDRVKMSREPKPTFQAFSTNKS